MAQQSASPSLRSLSSSTATAHFAWGAAAGASATYGGEAAWPDGRICAGAGGISNSLPPAPWQWLLPPPRLLLLLLLLLPLLLLLLLLLPLRRLLPPPPLLPPLWLLPPLRLLPLLLPPPSVLPVKVSRVKLAYAATGRAAITS